jgi:hypothetical protein
MAHDSVSVLPVAALGKARRRLSMRFVSAIFRNSVARKKQAGENLMFPPAATRPIIAASALPRSS